MERLYFPFTYEGQIRTLNLFRTPSGAVQATLQVIDLSTEPLYTCLSYTWGGPRWDDEGDGWTLPSESVTINGIVVDIGLNLRNALNYLCKVLAGRAIWIDAICINQRDILERNSQVTMMSRIYRQAQDVVVWLGEATPTWKAAIQDMERPDLVMEHYGEQVMIEELLQARLSNENLVNIVHFLTGNRWFSRMWTLQEYILARSIQFLCGNVLISLETVWKGAAIATMAGLTTAWADLDVRREEWIKDFVVRVMVSHRNGHELDASLGTNAHSHRCREAMDPKDKVFGVLGISRTSDKWIKEPFHVDYSLSTQTIYIKAAAFGLVAWKGLEALCHVGDQTKNKIPNLPSWVPDFTQPLPWKPVQSTGQYMKFKAASNLHTELWLGCVSEGAVAFNSYPVDTVVDTCDAYWTESRGDCLAKFLRLLFCPSSAAEVYDENVASMMLRLMVADGFKNEGIDPRSNLSEWFEQWLFSALFSCDEAHDGQVESALAFWKDPASCATSMAERLGMQPQQLASIMETIANGAKQCKSIEDIKLGLVGRTRTSGRLAEHLDSMRHKFQQQWEFAGKNRRFFRTRQGYMGLAPCTTQKGDHVMLLHGAHVPYLFRHLPNDPENVFDFVGETYLHGFMYGEAFNREVVTWGKIAVY